MRIVTKIIHNIVTLYFLIYVYRFHENYFIIIIIMFVKG